MKIRLFLLVIFCAVSIHAESSRYVIGLSPFLDKDVKNDVYRRIVGMILEDLPAQSSLSIYDAYNLTTITRVEIPEARAFRSGKTRANQFKDQIFKIKDFLAATHTRPEVQKLSLNQAVRFPQFLDFIGENVGGLESGLSVIVLGSPLYLDHKEPGFSMVDGYFPSDGHLLASREDSVFGLKSREHALQNVTVHFGYFGDPWVSGVHQEKITRFWNLYLQSQGARLGSFCGDLATLFASAKSNSTMERNDQLDRSKTKIEMLRITRDIGVADWITRDLPIGKQPPPTKTTGPMKIGIRWKGDIDLDLYASATRDSERLYFEHTRSPEGYYFKDHRHSPEREYEFIEFEAPIDVFSVEAAINFYAGDAGGGPNGEIRIEFEGRIYQGKFSLVATRGNKGREGNSQNDFWSRIDVSKILGLREQRAARD